MVCVCLCLGCLVAWVRFWSWWKWENVCASDLWVTALSCRPAAKRSETNIDNQLRLHGRRSWLQRLQPTTRRRATRATRAPALKKGTSKLIAMTFGVWPALREVFGAGGVGVGMATLIGQSCASPISPIEKKNPTCWACRCACAACGPSWFLPPSLPTDRDSTSWPLFSMASRRKSYVVRTKTFPCYPGWQVWM